MKLSVILARLGRRLPATPGSDRSPKAGFTLVELLLVVAILGILAGMVVVNLSGQSESARISATRASISAIGTAISVYEAETSRLPDSLEQLTVPTEDRPGLLRREQLKDSWGIPFQYRRTGRFEYEIRSAGPDMQMGTADDITN